MIIIYILGDFWKRLKLVSVNSSPNHLASEAFMPCFNLANSLFNVQMSKLKILDKKLKSFLFFLFYIYTSYIYIYTSYIYMLIVSSKNAIYFSLF